jgi:hypothetical protein
VNSFVVLNNDELISRSRIMGVTIDEAEMEKIDLLRDLELARANLNEKPNTKGDEECHETLNHLPLEEMKYIECKSDSSEEEEFQMVIIKRSKKRKKEAKTTYKKAKGKETQPLDGSSTSQGGVSRASSKYNLRKGAA